MHLTLYHGSEKVVPSPSLSEGRIHNDFGRGFYCTCDRERARNGHAPAEGTGSLTNIACRPMG